MPFTRREFVAGTAAVALIRDASAVSSRSLSDLVLRYDAPAVQWTDALPLGNGRLGAMLRGADEKGDSCGERLQLNEETLWSGMPVDGNNPDAVHHLQALREAVLERGDYHAADELCKKMQGRFGEAYQPAGDLCIEPIDGAKANTYVRTLDLDTATHVVHSGNVVRETFISHADQIIVHVLRVKGRARFRIALKSAQRNTVSVPEQGLLLLAGKVPAHVQGAGARELATPPVVYSDKAGEGMHFAIAAKIVGGKAQTKADAIELEIADETAFIVCDIATGYRGFDQTPDTPLSDLKQRAMTRVKAVAQKKLVALRRTHIESYQPLFRRVSLRLGAEPSSLTRSRVQGFAANPDPSLLTLYFQYGRYLMIASSRPGASAQPANLQGIWNEDLRPPWSSNWTSNINIQMNYWPAETCNLSDCAQPLFHFIQELSRNGARTAKVHYGVDGWCSHHNIDVWKISNPVGEGVGAPTWANWNMSGPWLCQHLYEHYRFTGDRTYLAYEAYPLMRSSAQFCLGMLIADGKGNLTTCPSESTENNFLAPDGKPAMTSAGCTMDMALMRELFANCIASAKELGIDQEFSLKLKDAADKLIPYRVGRWGQLQEWSEDFEEATPGQRHMSHLYGLYPGDAITPEDTPAFAQAARKSLERRLENGGAYTGWSRAWAIGFWARLQDGEKAWESLSMLMQHSTNENLLDTHPMNPKPVFQIDGNFGATAAMAEMLLQSHRDELHLLPALPKAWAEGEVSGLVARGGFEVSMRWAGGRLMRVQIKPRHDGKHAIRYGNTQKTVAFVKGRSITLDGVLSSATA